MREFSEAGGDGEDNRVSVRPKLTTEQKEYVVRRLAAYDRPCDIVKSLREQFGVVAARQSIERYDPTRSRACPERWRQLFFATRLSMVRDTSDQRPVGRPSRERERLLLHAVEALADRILTSMSDKGDGIVAKPLEEISDDDRVSALVTFVNRLKAVDPDGYARIQAALKDNVGSAGNDV